MVGAILRRLRPSHDLGRCPAICPSGRARWRLPNIKELRSLVERACREPALNTAVFPMSGDTGYSFWSSTSGGETSYWAMAFDFVLGKPEEEPKESDEIFVRLVRFP